MSRATGTPGVVVLMGTRSRSAHSRCHIGHPPGTGKPAHFDPVSGTGTSSPLNPISARPGSRCHPRVSPAPRAGTPCSGSRRAGGQRGWSHLSNCHAMERKSMEPPLH